MAKKITEIRKLAEELKQLGDDFPAVQRNLVRLLASTRMLELNVVDVKELL
jgi:hypothetical protein